MNKTTDHQPNNIVKTNMSAANPPGTRNNPGRVASLGTRSNPGREASLGKDEKPTVNSMIVEKSKNGSQAEVKDIKNDQSKNNKVGYVESMKPGTFVTGPTGVVYPLTPTTRGDTTEGLKMNKDEISKNNSNSSNDNTKILHKTQVSVVKEDVPRSGLFGGLFTSSSWIGSGGSIVDNVAKPEITNNSLNFEIDNMEFTKFQKIVIDIIEQNYFNDTPSPAKDEVNGNTAINVSNSRVFLKNKISSSTFKIYDLARLIMDNEAYNKEFGGKELNIDVIKTCLYFIENVYELVEKDHFYMVNDKKQIHGNLCLAYLKSSQARVAEIIAQYDELVKQSFLDNKTLVKLYKLKEYEFQFHNKKLKNERTDSLKQNFKRYEQHMQKVDVIILNPSGSGGKRSKQKLEIVFINDKYEKNSIEEITFYDSTIDILNFIINTNGIPTLVYDGQSYTICSQIPFQFEIN